jgi:hypothetical protein
MNNLPIKQQLLEIAKPLVVNQTVAKLLKHKTMTRRVVSNYLIYSTKHDCIEYQNKNGAVDVSTTKEFIDYVSKYKVGDIIWIREPAKIIHYSAAGNYGGAELDDYADVQYLGDGEIFYHWDDFPENAKSWLWDCKGIPNGCCKSLARYFYKITSIKVEGLQDISEKDIVKEGLNVDKYYMHDNILEKGDSPFTWYKYLWNATAKKRYRWEDKPFVFVYEYELVEYRC